jgi:hypothetical protein
LLTGRNTKRLVGIELFGDYFDLRNLYEDISVVLKAPVFVEDNKILNEFLYDIRHAYQGQRESETFHKDDELRKVSYFGVKIPWPKFILAVAYFRWGLAFIDSTKSQQSNAYRLEEITHLYLKNADPNVGEVCINWLQGFTGYPKQYLTQFFDECTYKYIYSYDKTKIRFSNLPQILYSTSILSNEYKQFQTMMEMKAKEKNCSPHELHSLESWPDFKW